MGLGSDDGKGPGGSSGLGNGGGLGGGYGLGNDGGLGGRTGGGWDPYDNMLSQLAAGKYRGPMADNLIRSQAGGDGGYGPRMSKREQAEAALKANYPDGIDAGTFVAMLGSFFPMASSYLGLTNPSKLSKALNLVNNILPTSGVGNILGAVSAANDDLMAKAAAKMKYDGFSDSDINRAMADWSSQKSGSMAGMSPDSKGSSVLSALGIDSAYMDGVFTDAAGTLGAGTGEPGGTAAKAPKTTDFFKEMQGQWFGTGDVPTEGGLEGLPSYMDILTGKSEWSPSYQQALGFNDAYMKQAGGEAIGDFSSMLKGLMGDIDS